MTVFEMAQKYYPRLWRAERIEALVKAGKLTKTQANKIIKETENDGANAEKESG